MFAITYLLPPISDQLIDIRNILSDEEADSIIISWIYADYYRAIIIIVFGLCLLIFGYIRKSMPSILLSAIIGGVYCIYSTGYMSLFRDRLILSIEHGPQNIFFGFDIIFRHQPDWIFKEVLAVLFLCAILPVVINLHNKSVKQTD